MYILQILFCVTVAYNCCAPFRATIYHVSFSFYNFPPSSAEKYSTCNIASFTNKENNSLVYSYLAANGSQKNNMHKSKISMTIAVVKFNEKERGSVCTSKHQVLVGLKNFLKQHVVDANAPVIECMKFFDPRYCTSHRTYGVDQLTSLHHHFSEPLSGKMIDIFPFFKRPVYFCPLFSFV